MGVYLQSDTFVSEMKYTDNVCFIIDFQKRTIKVEFEVGISYSLEIEFKDMDGDIYIENQGTKGRTITVASKFPAKFWAYNNKKQSLKRMVRIGVRKREGPLQPHMPDNSEQLGKWVVYRIVFDLDQVKKKPGALYRFNEMLEKTREFNLIPGEFNKPLRIVKGENLNKYVARSMLHFDVLYMVECNISFNYIHDYNLSNEFFYILKSLPTQNAVHILEKMFEAKKRIYDPMSDLLMHKSKLEGVLIKPNHVPSYCAMMRKIIVTPTTMYMLPPTMETSNRVIRHFQDKKDNFLRVHFADEAS
ncbi:hypothetical protein C1645_765566, partial [Glomus cerebriforme]